MGESNVAVPGSGLLVNPEPGAPYPEVLRGEGYSPLRSAGGALLAICLYFMLAGVFSQIILGIAWLFRRGDPGITDKTAYFAAAGRFEYWEGMLSAHLVIAALIPITLLMVRYLHRTHPGWLVSVWPGMRWRYLLVCLLIALVVFAGYVATMPLRGQPLHWNPQPGYPAFLVVILLTSPLQAAGEEFLFRGYLMQSLGSLVRRPWFGVLLSALVFALFHGQQSLPLFVSRFVFGLLAALLVLGTGGLEAGIATHVVNNLYAFTLAALTQSVAQAMGVREITWLSAFGDVVVFAIYAVLAWLAGRAMGVRTRVGGSVTGPR